MNIKSIANNLIPFDIARSQRGQKAEPSTERDPTGGGAQEQHPQKKNPRRNLSEDEINAAIGFLKQLKGVKENNLNIRLVKQNGVPVVFIEDQNKKIIRRIPETELSMIDVTEKAKGNLLDKSL